MTNFDYYLDSFVKKIKRTFSMTKKKSSLAINDAEAAVFAKDGYVLKKGLFTIDKITALNNAVKMIQLLRNLSTGVTTPVVPPVCSTTLQPV
jgi:hypothetical protein